MNKSEFLKLVRWADTAKRDEEFWKRMMAASATYLIEEQLKMGELLRVANIPSPTPEETNP